jgi:hypothetical protein
MSAASSSPRLARGAADISATVAGRGRHQRDDRGARPTSARRSRSASTTRSTIVAADGGELEVRGERGRREVGRPRGWSSARSAARGARRGRRKHELGRRSAASLKSAARSGAAGISATVAEREHDQEHDGEHDCGAPARRPARAESSTRGRCGEVRSFSDYARTSGGKRRKYAAMTSSSASGMTSTW